MLIRHTIRAIKSLLFIFRVAISRTHEQPDAVLIIYNKYNPLYWLASDPGLKDRIVYRQLVTQGYRVNVLFNPTIAQVRSQPQSALAWLNPHHFIFSNERRRGDYKTALHKLIAEIDDHFRACIPSHPDILFWENKVHMYKTMHAVGLRHPNTVIVENPTTFDWGQIEFPQVVKSDDGYSSNGLWLITEIDQIYKTPICSLPAIVTQEFLNITWDIRVICVRGIVVSFYWRINPASDQWRPTATQNGATVKFIDLPAKVAELACSIYHKTGCITYGADICFKNDDLQTDPYILEFSPIYQPNPIPPRGLITSNYSNFKKHSMLKYDQEFEALVGHIFYMILNGERSEQRGATL